MTNTEHTKCGTPECCGECQPIINNRSHIPEEREWEYDGTGTRVYKGTNRVFNLEQDILEYLEDKGEGENE